MKSSSSMSIPVRSGSTRKSSKNDTKPSVEPAATTMLPSNAKKRRPSTDTPARLDSSAKETPTQTKTAKRRKR